MILLQDLGLGYITENSKYRCQLGLYRCPTCSSEVILSIAKVKTQNTKQCRPCYLQVMKKHGFSGSRLYKIWASMKDRCLNPNNPAYEQYGNRGITVCKDWLNFLSFKDWALATGYKEELTLDRKNNDCGYMPDNCRWATYEEQNQNTRLLKSTNTSGYRGIFADKNKPNKWRAAIRVKGKRIYLGTYDNAKEAAMAYDTYVIKNNMGQPTNFK